MEIYKKILINPDNPRTITKKQFDSLKKSIKAFTKMLKVRPIVYDENWIVLGGNMRLLAVQALVAEGFDAKDEYFASAEGWTEEEKKEFIIKDNISFGTWDWDKLANEWDSVKLAEWGMDVTKLEDDFYTRNITSPIYKPSDWKPDITELMDQNKTQKLLADIEASTLPEEEKILLRMAAFRHNVFNYAKIADYYANATPEMQKLMEDSALVIIDYKKAIELGYIALTKGIAGVVKEDYDE